MKKRGQATILIVVAVVILAIVGLYFVFKTPDTGNNQKIAPEVAPIHSFVESCISEMGANAVFYIGLTGGYFKVPEISTENNIAYYLYNGENYMPSKTRVEKELSTYMDEILSNCIDDFKTYPEFNIKPGVISTTTKIEDEKVIFNVNYPITLSKGEKNYQFNEFKNIEVPIRLGIVFSVVQEIMDEQMFDKKSICINCVTNFAIQKDLVVRLDDDKEANIVVFNVIDKKSKYGDIDFSFSFANKYG
ncbi:MAG: hypothetical protein WC867_02575 [Candidatus Pacearchaeota archaeon]|jgi:hypothetical protein